MKRILILLLAGALVLGFAACAKKKDDTTSTTAKATTQTTADSTNEGTTKESEEKTDIRFIYNGYWYQNDENKVIVYLFNEDGTLTAATYRKKTISNNSNQPDYVTNGTFKNNGDGTLNVYPDSENEDEMLVYTVDATAKKLTCTRDDPQGASHTDLVNYDSLSRQIAKSVLLGDN